MQRTVRVKSCLLCYKNDFSQSGPNVCVTEGGIPLFLLEVLSDLFWLGLNEKTNGRVGIKFFLRM